MTDSNALRSDSSPLLTDTLLLETLTGTANSFAAANGLQVATKPTAATASNVLYQMAPISLLPQAYPRTAFANAQRLAPHFNRLVERVSRNAAFLQDTLGGSVATQDAYTAKLLQLYLKIYHPSAEKDHPGRHAQTADRLGILRSDYMLHRRDDDEAYSIQQVELNTIASSFAGLARQVAQLHRHLLARYANNDVQQFLLNNQKVISRIRTAALENDGVPSNPTLERLPYAMHLAVQRYRERFLLSDENRPCGILFVVQEGETNTVDQRMLEFQLWETHRIPVVRMSLSQIHARVRCDDNTGALTVCDQEDSGLEIALVYYRAGYAPTDYPGGYENGVEWQARELLEVSRATKCPNLGYHLAGTKKVQQQLSRPGVLEQFFPGEAAVVTELRQAFAGLYSLGEDANETDVNAVRDVFVNAHKYVLKPQREGGGYNFYGDQLLQKIKDNVVLSDDEKKLELSEALGEYILMERLFPPQQTGILMRGGKVEGTGPTISELGCFGTILVAGDAKPASDAVVHNEYSGFLLRTKFSTVDEGGVASGFATLSSPYLC